MLTPKPSFTTRGKVALAFSCLSGILGVIVVAWYGLAPDTSEHPDVAKRIAEANVDTPPNGLVETSKNNVGEAVVPTASAGSGGVRE